MTGPELTAIKQQLGMKSAALAKILGVHWTTISRWEHGHVPIPQIAAAFLQHLRHCEPSHK